MEFEIRSPLGKILETLAKVAEGKAEIKIAVTDNFGSKTIRIVERRRT